MGKTGEDGRPAGFRRGGSPAARGQGWGIQEGVDSYLPVVLVGLGVAEKGLAGANRNSGKEELGSGDVPVMLIAGVMGMRLGEVRGPRGTHSVGLLGRRRCGGRGSTVSRSWQGNGGRRKLF